MNLPQAPLPTPTIPMPAPSGAVAQILAQPVRPAAKTIPRKSISMKQAQTIATTLKTKLAMGYNTHDSVYDAIHQLCQPDTRLKCVLCLQNHTIDSIVARCIDGYTSEPEIRDVFVSPALNWATQRVCKFLRIRIEWVLYDTPTPYRANAGANTILVQPPTKKNKVRSGCARAAAAAIYHRWKNADAVAQAEIVNELSVDHNQEVRFSVAYYIAHGPLKPMAEVFRPYITTTDLAKFKAAMGENNVMARHRTNLNNCCRSIVHQGRMVDAQWIVSGNGQMWL